MVISIVKIKVYKTIKLRNQRDIVNTKIPWKASGFIAARLMMIPSALAGCIPGECFPELPPRHIFGV